MVDVVRDDEDKPRRLNFIGRLSQEEGPETPVGAAAGESGSESSENQQ